ncbi:hypothetical protein ACLOJK_020068 [Asimina triloba]
MASKLWASRAASYLRISAPLYRAFSTVKKILLVSYVKLADLRVTCREFHAGMGRRLRLRFDNPNSCLSLYCAEDFTDRKITDSDAG